MLSGYLFWTVDTPTTLMPAMNPTMSMKKNTHAVDSNSMPPGDCAETVAVVLAVATADGAAWELDESVVELIGMDVAADEVDVDAAPAGVASELVLVRAVVVTVVLLPGARLVLVVEEDVGNTLRLPDSIE